MRGTRAARALQEDAIIAPKRATMPSEDLLSQTFLIPVIRIAGVCCVRNRKKKSDD